MSGGVQEGGRWSLRAHLTRPTVAVIEPKADEEQTQANAPFGFAKANVEPEVEVDEAWEGQGL